MEGDGEMSVGGIIKFIAKSNNGRLRPKIPEDVVEADDEMRGKVADADADGDAESTAAVAVAVVVVLSATAAASVLELDLELELEEEGCRL